MHLQSSIVVGQTNNQVWDFFNELTNLVKWDRSVAQVIPTSSEPWGVGSTFDTISPVLRSHPRQKVIRMSYRITEHIPDYKTTIQLIHSHMFKNAEWTTITEEVSEGVRITCQLVCSLRPLYSFLFPVLLLTYREAFRRDLLALKQAIEQHADAN